MMPVAEHSPQPAMMLRPVAATAALLEGQGEILRGIAAVQNARHSRIVALSGLSRDLPHAGGGGQTRDEESPIRKS